MCYLVSYFRAQRVEGIAKPKRKGERVSAKTEMVLTGRISACRINDYSAGAICHVKRSGTSTKNDYATLANSVRGRDIGWATTISATDYGLPGRRANGFSHLFGLISFFA